MSRQSDDPQKDPDLVEERKKRLRALDAEIERGIADAAAARVKPLREVRNRLVAKYRDTSVRDG